MYNGRIFGITLIFREGDDTDKVAYFPSMDYRRISGITLLFREGDDTDKVAYFPSMDYGPDSNRTLELQDLVGQCCHSSVQCFVW